MISGPALSLVFLVAVAATVPHLVASGGLRSRLVRHDAASTMALVALWHLAGVLDLDVSASTACGVLVAAKLVHFAIVIATETDATAIEWSPARAGLLAALVYLALIPNVLAWPTDGDESYYVLAAESVVADFDLDLRNQYGSLERSATGRLDIGPQPGDPVGPGGEQYSRHEPLLSLLLVPGLLVAGLGGAVATIALVAALAVRSLTALVAEDGAEKRVQLFVSAVVGLTPPFLDYALRIWPEAPGAFLLAEMLRAARGRKVARLVVFGVLLSALKLRFAPIAIVLLAIVLFSGRVRARQVAVGLLAVTAVLAGAWLLMPGLFEARSFDPRTVFVPDNFARGFLGVLLDGQGGLLFQAPVLLVALVATLRWRMLGEAARLGCLTALPYLVLLLPRSEWHGGWSPPLRYLVVFTPVFALLLVPALRIARPLVVAAAVAYGAALAVRAIALPPSRFRIASGESALGEHLSVMWGTDFSKLVPSLIRPNEAAMWGAVALVLVIALAAVRRGQSRETRWNVAAVVLSGSIAAAAWGGFQPGRVVEFEDAHVQHRGGELYPERWTVARFRFRGGWTLMAGDAVEFRHAGGTVSLAYYCDQPTVIEIDGVAYDVPTGREYADLVFSLPATDDDRHEIRCLTGALILDKLATE